MEDFLEEEEEAIPRNRGITQMKRADLIAELRHERIRIQAMVKRRDEIKAALRQCNMQLTDTRRISEEREREIQELANERNALLQTLQQEMSKNEMLSQQILEQDQSKSAIVQTILQDNEAKETHLNLEIGVIANQRDDLHQEMQGVKEELSRIHEENSCSICLLPWEAEGHHRIVSLKCGHLFGDCCIRQHLAQRADCGICKQPVSHEDLRYLFGFPVLVAAQPAPLGQAAP
ncbi:E3 ubiquitin-protein ligase RNF8-like [Drosophila subpulchrella]|uniref:E3 ubiquitin-protein ligase RNF8-like n=1 Tax=Drosophila subpulchrella TaxID=1486046 RepID=UPI0018A17490|nr:E3 ubiquitin-protein ligase RNF8-like [Drosophila subpulchrella]